MDQVSWSTSSWRLSSFNEEACRREATTDLTTNLKTLGGISRFCRLKSLHHVVRAKRQDTNTEVRIAGCYIGCCGHYNRWTSSSNLEIQPHKGKKKDSKYNNSLFVLYLSQHTEEELQLEKEYVPKKKY